MVTCFVHRSTRFGLLLPNVDVVVVVMVVVYLQRYCRLCVFVGTGIQLFCMLLLTIVFSMFGMLSPASRGSLVTAAIILFVFFGYVKHLCIYVTKLLAYMRVTKFPYRLL